VRLKGESVVDVLNPVREVTADADVTTVPAAPALPECLVAWFAVDLAAERCRVA
jgi:hypothetical protein